MSGKYYIVYAGGNESILAVIFLAHSVAFEISDYRRASRQDFYERKEAVTYAKDLAKKYGKTYKPDPDEDDEEDWNNYLD